MRKVKFKTEHYYHIYNRGVDKRNVFLDSHDYARFIRSMREFNNDSYHNQRTFVKNRRLEEPELSSEASELSSRISHLPRLVELIAYCLNPNHYHFLLKQSADGGVTKFMHKISLGYTNYFNTKYQRSGSLFQGTYKAAEMKYDDHLIDLSVYVNANNQIHGLTNDASKYIWCSYPDYLGQRNGNLCNNKVILDEFQSIAEYKNYVDKQIPIIKEDKQIQKYLLE